ncbi:glycosyltransferase family 2 protein [Mucilaginibacter sp. SD-g]|uniref:Glycosyltransferase family 2 protein n=1 Tax=Mucilaginibacter segetis TaxID=2793071 RepID=A0A934PWV1_9SPHI|nr:glycosyltransferase family 2 protein [Mucilaginibacter segetis]
MKFSVLVPTLNAGSQWRVFLENFAKQSVKPHSCIIIDSGSTDETVALALEAGFTVKQIDKRDFRHGATRQELVNLSVNCDICVFLTQDAILAAEDSLEKLIAVFLKDNKVALAYGRQLPHLGAKTLETHARLFNYPPVSEIRTLKDKERLGFKTIFCSDSFAAYRKEVLNRLGGFPPDTIMGEDTIVAAEMLKAGYKIAYVAEATVHHSHTYTLKEEFKRYFDTGVFHTQNSHLKKEFGNADGEGLRYVLSEMRYVIKNRSFILPYSMFSVMAKWLGYKLGVKYRWFSHNTVKNMSMHKSYWSRVHN